MTSRRDLIKAGAMAARAGAVPSSVTLVDPVREQHKLAAGTLWAGGACTHTSFQNLEIRIMRARLDARACTRVFALCLGLGLLVLPGAAQQSSPSPDDKYPENPTKQENAPSRSAGLGRRPIEWIIGPYIPVQGRLETLSNAQRGQIYFRQTFLTAGSYVARAFSAGLDQACGEPSDWGGGSVGYGRRYVVRYGEFVVQNSILSGGNALLGYELWYDFCRCEGFWPRMRHAISRNFVAYDRSEHNFRS